MKPLDRALSRVEKQGSCWLYQGALANGYGRMPTIIPPEPGGAA